MESTRGGRLRRTRIRSCYFEPPKSHLRLQVAKHRGGTWTLESRPYYLRIDVWYENRKVGYLDELDLMQSTWNFDGPLPVMWYDEI